MPILTVSDESDHSELPPSSADKWMVCPAWRRLNAPLPRGKSSAAADEGTQAHALLENALAYKREEVQFNANPEMAKHIDNVMIWVKKQKGQVLAETQVDFGQAFGYVGLFGTSDIVIVHDNHITVADLKYGFGLVEVEDNPQLMLYLVGAVAKYGERKSYRLVILQPRGDHFKGPIREVKVTKIQLKQFKVKLEKAIADSYTNKPPVVGAHCRKYCNALGVCPGVKEHALRLFKETAHD